MKSILSRTFVLRFVLMIFLFSDIGFAKTPYRSAADEELTVRTITILPVFDNLQGIYARPVEKHLNDKFEKNHRFEFRPSEYAGALTTPEELQENPQLLSSIMQSSPTDAIIAGRVIKGPSGISMRFDMYLKSNQKILAQVEENGITRLDTMGIKSLAEDMVNKLLKKLPYEGIIMSRQGNRVTLNLGLVDGISNDQVLSAIQIIKSDRHPKFGFLINTEKEILGKVKINKADQTLSFGRIITEKEAGAIDVGTKIAGPDVVVYSNTDKWTESSDEESLEERPDSHTSFGKSPTEWLPKKNPTFGGVGARLGLGTFSESVTSASDSLDTDAPYYPYFMLDGELWLTPNWTMHAGLRQGYITTDNPKSGGSPSELNHSLSAYEFMMGYTLRLGPSLWSPKIEILGGYGTYRLFVDESTPTGLVTRTYSGLKLGVSGAYPLSEIKKMSIGANLFLFWEPDMKEEPKVSGNADNDIKQFGLFLDQALGINLKARYGLDFEMYSSKYSGGSASQKYTNLGAGLYYLF